MFKSLAIAVYYLLFLYFSFYVGFMLEKYKLIINWYTDNIWWAWPTAIVFLLAWLLLGFLPIILTRTESDENELFEDL